MILFLFSSLDVLTIFTSNRRGREMSLRGYIYTKEKEMPASEAGIKPCGDPRIANVKTGQQR